MYRAICEQLLYCLKQYRRSEPDTVQKTTQQVIVLGECGSYFIA